jgi:hypothetical protein
VSGFLGGLSPGAATGDVLSISVHPALREQSKVKYIIIKATHGYEGGIVLERELPFIFPDYMVHEDVAKIQMELVRSYHHPEANVKDEIVVSIVAAGFISSLSIEGGCHGYSETLKIASRGKQDDDLIRTLDYLHGIV